MEIKKKTQNIKLKRRSSTIRKQKVLLKKKGFRSKTQVQKSITEFPIVENITKLEIRFTNGSYIKVKTVTNAVENALDTKKRKRQWRRLSKIKKNRIIKKMITSGAISFDFQEDKEMPCFNDGLNGTKEFSKSYQNVAAAYDPYSPYSVRNPVPSAQAEIISNPELSVFPPDNIPIDNDSKKPNADKKTTERSKAKNQTIRSPTGQDNNLENHVVINEPVVSKKVRNQTYINQAGKTAKVIGTSACITALSVTTLAEILSDEDSGAKVKQLAVSKAKRKIYEKATAPGKRVARNLTEKILNFARALVKQILIMLKAVIAPLLPFILIGFFVISALCIIISSLLGIIGSQQQTGKANVSAECERYRPLVVKYASKYGIPEYVELILAVMMQESGGRYPDVMQCSESGFNTKYPHAPNSITDPEYSIDCGVQTLQNNIVLSQCSSPADLDHLNLALQGYNYGSYYITWALAKDGKYTALNASEFSDMMAARMGWAAYGDKQYVQHVMQYYTISVSGNGGSALGDGSYKALIAEAEKYLGFPYVFGGSTPASSFDCSGFVCWVYTNSGVYNLPRTTAQGIYNQCSPISPADARPGDLIFFTGTYDECPDPVSHIGIYVGNGQMLHCGDPIQYTSCETVGWQQHFYGYGRLPVAPKAEEDNKKEINNENK